MENLKHYGTSGGDMAEKKTNDHVHGLLIWEHKLINSEHKLSNLCTLIDCLLFLASDSCFQAQSLPVLQLKQNHYKVVYH